MQSTSCHATTDSPGKPPHREWGGVVAAGRLGIQPKQLAHATQSGSGDGKSLLMRLCIASVLTRLPLYS